MMTFRLHNCLTFILLTAVLPLVGCGGDFQVAPVEGVVTLDNQPLANATVYYQPQRRGSDPVVGPPSIGVTNEEGHYSMRLTTGESGVVVGSHVVSISTFESRMVDPQNSDRTEIVSEESVPARYRSPSELKVDITSGGDDEANFSLMSK